MNADALKTTAHQLKLGLDIAKIGDAIAEELYNQLQHLIYAAGNGSILENMESIDIPSHRLFNETNLGNNLKLRRAYSNFYLKLIGAREWEAFKIFKASMDGDKAY